MTSFRHLKWACIATAQLNPLLQRQFVSTDRITVARFRLKKGCVIPAHHHENEQVTHVLKGELRFDFDGRKVTVRAGEVLCIPSHLPHSAEALENTLVVDLFSPPRHDWEQRQDDYLRGGAGPAARRPSRRKKRT